MILDVRRTFVTSDHHFGHRLMAVQRGFTSTREMDEELVSRWNAVVGPKDRVYHLGDVAYRCSPGYLASVLGRLNGKIVLVKGNHDHKVALKAAVVDMFSEVHDVLLLKVKGTGSPLEPNGQHLKMWLSHYSHQHWPSRHHGAVHFFGHSHGKAVPVGRSLEVCVECNGLAPFSLETALDRVYQNAALERAGKSGISVNQVPLIGVE